MILQGGKLYENGRQCKHIVFASDRCKLRQRVRRSISLAAHCYTDGIIRNGITGEYLCDLNEEEINDCFDQIGVTSKFHRKAIIKMLSAKLETKSIL